MRPQRMSRSAAVYGFLSILSLCSGCASFQPKPEPLRVIEKTEPEIVEVIPPEPPPPEVPPLMDRSRRGKPYEVYGKTYYPLLNADGYEEKGIASWYGPSFHGRRTSSGERFDMHKISAAHKLLPLHTRIHVTNLENGKTETLIVNDRGPFVPGRVLDLSYAAAKRLGMVEKGLARVLIRTSGQVQDQKKNDMIGSFFVHVGSFKRESDAMYLLEDMKSLKYRPSTIRVVRADRDGQIHFRVELGPFKTMSAANRAHNKTVRDYPSAFVVAGDPLVTANK